jgi:predicted SAM-dependent methyltransferase
VQQLPGFPEAVNLLGVIHWMDGQFDQSLELFLEAYNLTDFTDDKFVNNYLTLLLQHGGIQEIVKNPQLVAGCLKMMESYQRSDDMLCRIFHLVLKSCSWWPEIHGFWGYYVEYTLLYKDSIERWTTTALDLDTSLARVTVSSLIAIGLKQFPLDPGILILAGRASKRLTGPDCFAWFTKEAAVYRHTMASTNPDAALLDMVIIADMLEQNDDLSREENLWISEQGQLNIGNESMQCLRLLSTDVFGQTEFNDNVRPNPYSISLHIGCRTDMWWICGKPEWLVLDAVGSFAASLIGEMHNLSIFPDSSIRAVYSSHSLEHISYSLPYSPSSADRNVSQVCTTLVEWNRVLIRGEGVLYLSVPDLKILTNMFQEANRTFAEQMLLMSIIYGGQRDPYDFHKVGYFFRYLEYLLSASGFCGIEHITDENSFGLFDNDSSTMKIFGRSISLNVKAVACDHDAYSAIVLLENCNKVTSLNNMMDNGLIILK